MESRKKRLLSEFLTPEASSAACVIEPPADADPLIASLEYDSRKAGPQTLFFALTGLHTDGHKYINDAISRGAAAVVHEAEISEKKAGIAYIKVKNSRFAMSPLAAAFYGYPSRRLLTAGVTGTEGKSTCVYLIWQLLRLAGKKAGFFSTVQYSNGAGGATGDGAQWNKEHQTTPEAIDVQRLLWEMAENGCEYAVAESSSHGLSPKTNRLGDVEFNAALCTNVTHEHLEFHGTWEQYRDDKANLFRALDRARSKFDFEEPFGVINADDPSAVFFANATGRATLSFSVYGGEATLSVKQIESGAKGNSYKVLIRNEKEVIDIRDNLPGAFNAGNVLASLLVVSGMTKIPVPELAHLCPKLLPVRGRMTAVDKGQNFEVLVDYAHTPSSFQAVFPPLRERLDGSGSPKRRIISLFGSAGERDTQKRAEQGKIAAMYSDIIVLTDEDPRGEVPIDILNEIAAGIYAEKPSLFKQGENLFLIPDRPAAIRKAFSLAREGDLALLLGKGHENTIIYKDRVMPYDEIGEAEKALQEGARND